MDRIISRAPLMTALAVFACAATVTHAQQRLGQLPGGYPYKPIRIIVNNAPGGGIDITARAVAQKLGERLGRSVVVDNRAGGTGVIAMDLAAQAAPDGYTLLIMAGSVLASAMVQKKVSYDIRTAYAPVTQLTSQYYLLLVIPSLPVNSVKDLLAYAKSKPGALSFGSAGMGSTGHAGLELLKSMAGVDIVHVPYKGIGPALIDMISGQLQLAFASTISGMQHVRSGKLKALAVTSLRRAQVLPELPTVSEAGVPGFELNNWFGLYAPAGTPPAVVFALHRNVSEALNSSDIQGRFANDGAEATASASPADFRETLAKEVAKWEKIVRMPNFANSLR